MAPECIPGNHHDRQRFAGRRADMWALGFTVFECCVGRHWQIDWHSLRTDTLASAFIEAQIATVPTTDPWILAVLRNTLKM
jgi:serine/threonine protein kinase